VSLHNKFPDHFYKKGNLFGTYLSAGAVDHSKEQPATLGPSPASVTELFRFLRNNLDVNGAATWVRLVEKRRQSGASPAIRSWSDVEIYVKSTIPSNVARKYVDELKRRKQLGEQLVQPSRS
jgi:hypothetical protein